MSGRIKRENRPVVKWLSLGSPKSPFVVRVHAGLQKNHSVVEFLVDGPEETGK